MKILKENGLSILIIILLVFLGSYLILSSYFSKKIQFSVFEECMSAVRDPLSNWITRKGTVKYCIEQTQ